MKIYSKPLKFFCLISTMISQAYAASPDISVGLSLGYATMEIEDELENKIRLSGMKPKLIVDAMWDIDEDLKLGVDAQVGYQVVLLMPKST